jgi:hypothetical protein
MSDDLACKECGHHWGDHYKNDGCYGGWKYNSEGIAVNEGCLCLLAHSRESLAKPPSTREVNRAESQP